MPKERTLNPATAHLKSEKARSIKKSKSQQTTLRNEKLARRNPERLQRQIDDLKAADALGTLRPKDKQDLERLERDVKAVRKAREALGAAAPSFGAEGRGRRDDNGRGRDGFGGAGRGRGGSGWGGGVLGKRRRGQGDDGGDSDSSETDVDARAIPMPLDVENMPPVPRPRGARPDAPPDGALALPPKPVPQAQTVYESAPIIRDLRKEAARFVPAVVQQKIKAVRGEGRLLEPEEAERLEREGYRDAETAAEEAAKEAAFGMMAVEGEGGLEEEERKFQREVRRVEVEEVEDEAV